MKFELERITRNYISTLTPYSSARDEFSGTASIFLDANENPYGSVTSEKYNRYPDPYQQDLKVKIGEIKKISPTQIFLGNGSDEAIDLLFRIFCEPHQDNIIITPPTYGMYQVSAETNCTEIREIPLSPENFQLRPDEILKEVDKNTKIIFLCSPNNPTGNSLQTSDIQKVIENFSGIVIVDEAYIDFSASPTWISELKNYPNLVVLQTFSKAWGLAGLRLGMAFASEAIIQLLNKIKLPYNISQIVQETVLENLSEFKKQTMVNQVLKERKSLHSKLENLDFVQKIYESDANFLLIKVDEAQKIYDQLVTQQIIVRNRSKVILCEDCLRITVGTETENQVLVETLRSF